MLVFPNPRHASLELFIHIFNTWILFGEDGRWVGVLLGRSSELGDSVSPDTTYPQFIGEAHYKYHFVDAAFFHLACAFKL
jgi:hypothetical protein